MSLAPGKVRLQVTIPSALRDELAAAGQPSGMTANDVAAVYLAEGAARTSEAVQAVRHGKVTTSATLAGAQIVAATAVSTKSEGPA